MRFNRQHLYIFVLRRDRALKTSTASFYLLDPPGFRGHRNRTGSPKIFSLFVVANQRMKEGYFS